MSYYRDQLESWLKTIEPKLPTNQRVLDIGGGAKPITSRLKKLAPVVYHILDTGLETQAQTPDIVHDMNEALTEALSQETYGLIFCLELMEYIYDPVQAMINLYYFAEPGATIVITFPFVYPIHKPTGYDYLRYTPHAAARLLAGIGFEIDETELRLDKSGQLYKFYKTDGMHIDQNPHLTGTMIIAHKPATV